VAGNRNAVGKLITVRACAIGLVLKKVWRCGGDDLTMAPELFQLVRRPMNDIHLAVDANVSTGSTP
jgi:hypothetical protein